MRLGRHLRGLRRAPSRSPLQKAPTAAQASATAEARRLRLPSSPLRRCSSVGLRTHSSAASRSCRLGCRIGAGRRRCGASTRTPTTPLRAPAGAWAMSRVASIRSPAFSEPIQRLDGIVAAGKRGRAPRHRVAGAAARAARSPLSLFAVLPGVWGEAWLGRPQPIMVMPPLSVSIASARDVRHQALHLGLNLSLDLDHHAFHRDARLVDLHRALADLQRDRLHRLHGDGTDIAP